MKLLPFLKVSFSFCPADGAVLRCGGVPGQPVHLLDHRKHLGGHVSSLVHPEAQVPPGSGDDSFQKVLKDLKNFI